MHTGTPSANRLPGCGGYFGIFHPVRFISKFKKEHLNKPEFLIRICELWLKF